MYAIEFRARIKDGLIEIPEKFRNRLKDNVKVILLTEHETETSPESDIIEELLESPLDLADFRPYKREEVGSGVEEVTEPSAVILSAAKNLLL